jgi:thermitase
MSAGPLCVALLAATIGSAPAPATESIVELIDGHLYTRGEIIIAARDPDAGAIGVAAAAGLIVVDFDEVSGAVLCAVPFARESDMMQRLGRLPQVAFVERNGVGAGGIVPNDTHFVSQWHLRNTGQSGGTVGADIDAVRAWDLETGSTSVIVAVLDTGIDSDHPEFVGRIAPNGFDFVNEDANPEADHAHGTWVSGCIAANADNGFAVAGVDWHCKILPIKVLDQFNGGTNFDLAQGLNYVATLPEVDIVNMSLINYPNSASLQSAVLSASLAGKILAVCAGNGGIGNADVSFPGAYPQSISIGNTTRTDARNPSSGTGVALDFVAPGTSIVTAAHNTNVNTFDSVTGCSFATPNTAGVIALLVGRAETDYGRTLTQADVVELLRRSAEDQVGPPAEDVPGRDNFFGWGRVNAYFAILALDCWVRDLDSSGGVDLADLTRLLANFGLPALPADGDISGDGIVDLRDLTLMLSGFGADCGA